MASIHPYLNFAGNTEDAFNFYKSVFGGEFSSIVRFSDMPNMPGAEKLSEQERNGLMHVRLPIGKHGFLMATDAVASVGHTVNPGDNFSLSLMVDSEEEGHQLFSGLSSGGQVEVPFSPAMWGGLFGMFTDKFGIRWMVNYEPVQSSN